MGKSRPKKSGTSKKRDASKRAHRHGPNVAPPPGSEEPITNADGMLSGMVGGFRRAVGAERPEQKSSLDGALLWVLFALVAGAVAWRYLG